MAESSKPTQKRALRQGLHNIQALVEESEALGEVPPYVLIEKLGSGAFATVFKAQHHVSF